MLINHHLNIRLILGAMFMNYSSINTLGIPKLGSKTFLALVNDREMLKRSIK